MGNMFLSGMSEVNCPMAIFPDWSFRDDRKLNLTHHRTQGGRMFSYLWGGFHAYRLPLSFVSSADHARILQWWETQDRIAFTLDSSATASTVFCRITNPTNPLGQHPPPYRTHFQGTLYLESLDHSNPAERPFVLDDNLLGLLDNPITALA